MSEFIGTSFLVMMVVGSGIMAEKLSTDELSILLANSFATGAGLTVLIWVFISVSGAHFNPVVSLVIFLRGELSFAEFFYFTIFQITGGFVGVILANTMFGLEPFQLATTERSGQALYLSESIATFGLLIVILGVRKLALISVAPAVGLYIAAGHWFTSSTSFANPAVTLARGFSDTFTGISPDFIFPFIFFQVLGAVIAMLFMKLLDF